MSPALLASIVLREDPDAGLEPILEAAEAYLASVPRTDEGAIVHWGEDTAFVDDDEVWIDSQFMVGMYLLSEHDRTGDRAYLDRFVEQYMLFSELCRDPAADLYRHAYDDGTDTNIPAEETFWARGNSWVLIAGAEALARLPSDDPAFEVVAPLFESHAASVLATQADDGLWHTVMNQPRGEDPANYTETSAAALFGYALVRGTASVLDPDEVREPLAALVAGLEERVVERDEALHVLGTSFGTNPGDYDYYVGIPQLDDQLLGYGSLVMFLAEVDGVPR